jgi:hypothetical protein
MKLDKFLEGDLNDAQARFLMLASDGARCLTARQLNYLSISLANCLDMASGGRKRSNVLIRELHRQTGLHMSLDQSIVFKFSEMMMSMAGYATQAATASPKVVEIGKSRGR